MPRALGMQGRAEEGPGLAFGSPGPRELGGEGTREGWSCELGFLWLEEVCTHLYGVWSRGLGVRDGDVGGARCILGL